MRILAVDDDEFILELLFEAMKVVGYPDVKTATCAAKALDLIRSSSERFECILLDIQMPEIDGIELCNTIRNIPGYQKTPVIMLTAMSERDYVDRAFAAGATDYVTKPFDILELGTRVKMAERLNAEQARTQQSHRSLDALTETLVNDRRIDLDSTVDVQDVDGFLGYSAFENYVAMLNRGSYFSSSLVSFKVENIRSIHKNCDAAGFEFAISDIAEAISDNIYSHGGFFTYAGYGIFVCVYNRVKDPISDEIEINVRDTIEQMDLVYDGGEKLEVNLSISEPVSPGVFSKPGSLGVIERAIQSVEYANLRKPTVDLPIELHREKRRWLRLPRVRRHA